MVINCLDPYMDVVIIGGTTVGKNVGSRNFSSPELMITMNPIVCKIYNSEGNLIMNPDSNRPTRDM